MSIRFTVLGACVCVYQNPSVYSWRKTGKKRSEKKKKVHTAEVNFDVFSVYRNRRVALAFSRQNPPPRPPTRTKEDLYAGGFAIPWTGGSERGEWWGGEVVCVCLWGWFEEGKEKHRNRIRVARKVVACSFWEWSWRRDISAIRTGDGRGGGASTYIYDARIQGETN